MIVSDVYVCDDPELRYMQLVEVTLTHCATVLWPSQPERVARAALQAEHLRRVLQRRLATAHHHGTTAWHTSEQQQPQNGDEHGDAAAAAAATTTTSPRKAPHKHGQNGLSVASVDTILCRKDVQARAGNGRSSNNNNNNAARVSGAVHDGSTDSRAEATARAATVAVTTASSSSSAVAATAAASSAAGAAPPTPATTQSGDVVLVSETGSPLVELLSVSQRLPLRVRRLSGGITNELFHIYDDADKSDGHDDSSNNNNSNGNSSSRSKPLAHTTAAASPSVVIRVFGKETERVISRESELFYQSLFLRTYVHGVNFLVYEFLPEHVVLPYTDMPREVCAIADVMAAFQVHATRAARRDYGKMSSNNNSSSNNNKGSYDCGCAVTADGHGTRFDCEDNYTLRALTTWVEQVASPAIVAQVQPDKRDDFLHLSSQLAGECAWMRAVLQQPALSGALGEGVCHNDLLSANIMRHTATGALTIIDFDYTKRNYLLFDIANHFNEYTGLECDYARYFPSDAHMAMFLRHYRRAARRHLRRVHATQAPQQRLQQQRQQRQQQQQEQEVVRVCNGHATNGCCRPTHHPPPLPHGSSSGGDSDGDDEDDDDSNSSGSSNSSMLFASYDKHCAHGDGDEVFDGERALFWSGSAAEEHATVLRWTRLVKLLTLASHLSWSVWSLLQEAVSALDVDFLSYAKLRYARYADTKHDFVRNVY